VHCKQKHCLRLIGRLTLKALRDDGDFPNKKRLDCIAQARATLLRLPWKCLPWEKLQKTAFHIGVYTNVRRFFSVFLHIFSK